MMRFLTTVLLPVCLLTQVATVRAVSSSMAQTGFSGLLRIPDADALSFADLSLNYHWKIILITAPLMAAVHITPS